MSPTRARPLLLLVLWPVWICTPATAEPTMPRASHISATLGWFGALAGPLPHGPALDLEIHPGGTFGRWGAGLYYRGLEGIGHGLFALGLVYDAAASRPRLQIGLHADIGYDTAHSLPAAGIGVRSQLGGIGLLVVAGDMSARLFIDGLESRLAFVFTLSAGLAR